MLARTLTFDPGNPAPTLAALPETPGVFALFGSEPQAEPYLAQTTNLRRRLKRLLDAKPSQTRRLRLTERVARIEYVRTGSDFESGFALYDWTLRAVGSDGAFAERARKRLRLHTPFFLRMTTRNRYPRVYVTNALTRGAERSLYGPFPARSAAERYCDELLNLFQLRRCYPDLDPHPAFPGCVYSEMKMCLAPCFQGCTDERYAEEAHRVEAFLATRGRSLLDELAGERNRASEELDFERAAALHIRIQKVEAVSALAAEAVRPLALLHGLIIQPSSEPGQVALFQLAGGMLTGPALYDTLGMRLHNEQSGSSSLYTHPYALEAVPLADSPAVAAKAPPATRDKLEERLGEALAQLQPAVAKPAIKTVADHLSLFSRWYYRPEEKRTGEVIFSDINGREPARQILRAISRVARGHAPVAAAVQAL